MAVTKLTNTQIQDLVNQAYRQATGSEDVTNVMDLSQFSDTGVKDVLALRERFTGALIGIITKNWFLDSSYRSSYIDPFFEDSAQFGAIVQAISATVPEVKENSAWNTFTNGVTKVGQYTVYLPVVETMYYAKTESWALPITITGEQWDSAFESEAKLSDFVSYIFMMVDNAIVQHIEDLNNANRNNFIAEKIDYATKNPTTGIHVVDLVKAYAMDRGLTTNYTVEEFLSNADPLRFAIEQLNLYKGYIQKQTKLFNTEGKVRFTPENRLVVQLLDFFVTRLDTVARSSTFHADMVSLPNYNTVPSWQSMNKLTFDELSSINVKIGENTTVEKSGIVGMICDKWAIVHTIKSHRVATQRFNIENLTLYEYQFRDQYINNLAMNAVIFVLSDYVAG